MLNTLLADIGQPIVYYPSLIRVTGDLDSNIFLSYIYFWQNHAYEEAEGWIYKTAEAITKDTGLNKREQKLARQRLLYRGLMDEKRKGLPAKMYYKVNVNKLIDMWSNHNKNSEDADPYTTAEKIIATYSAKLTKMSHLSMTRAETFDVEIEFVDYNKVLREHGAWCKKCGKIISNGPGNNREDLRFVHIKPLEEGGKHTIENIIPSHFYC